MKTQPYVFPPIDLLKKESLEDIHEREQRTHHVAKTIQYLFDQFKVRATVEKAVCGLYEDRYEVRPGRGVRVRAIKAIENEIRFALSSNDTKIEISNSEVPTLDVVVPCSPRLKVGIRSIIESPEFQNHSSGIAFAVGKDENNNVVVSDIAKMPHLLIGGTTGSGKSVFLNSLILSLLYKSSPEEVEIIMIDTKTVDLSIYNGIPHLLVPVITDWKKATVALNWCIAEMEDRYKKFAELGVKTIDDYNQVVKGTCSIGASVLVVPRIIVIVDGFSDLMEAMPQEVEESVCKLAQLSRASGIHLIVSTQRPSTNVITGAIKANIPSRIAFSTSSGADSKVILDVYGAEKLLSNGDMLFHPQGCRKPIHIQSAFVSDEEVANVVDFLKSGNDGFNIKQQITKVWQASISARAAEDTDELFADAGKFIIEKDKASIGMLQRNFKIGFNRAARIMDQLSDAGVVGPEEGTKPRKILMSSEKFEKYLREL